MHFAAELELECNFQAQSQLEGREEEGHTWFLTLTLKLRCVLI
jgi:hypothetical protein